MKTFFIGAIFVLGVLAVLFVLTGGNETHSPLPEQTQPSNSSDADYKNLKIQ